MAEEDEQQPYVDPNSGLASQPGGYAHAIGVAQDDEDGEDPNPDPGGSSVLVDGVITDASEVGEVAPADNTTEPEDANDPAEDEPEENNDGGVEALEGADEPSAADFAEREHQATGDLVGEGEPNPDEGGSQTVVDGVVTEVETEGNEVGSDGTSGTGDNTEPAEESSAVEEPSKGASRATWVEFARTQGAPEEELGEGEGALKRDELAAKYGS